MGNLNSDVKITIVQDTISAGQTDPDSASVDMSGFEGVLFIGVITAQEATGTASLQAEDSADDSSFAAITGGVITGAANSDNKVLVLDIFRPRDRYVRVAMTLAVADTTWGMTIAIQYGASNKPTTHVAADMAATAVGIVGV